MKKTGQIAFLLFVVVQLSSAQDFRGKWVGELTQKGKPDRFIYELELTQDGDRLSGYAFSTDRHGVVAKFEMGGLWKDSVLILQEVEQLEPPSARWCLKHMRLRYSKATTGDQLQGPWEAQGCTPGNLQLHRAPSSAPPGANSEQGTSRSPLPDSPGQTIPGRWSGYLSQSDRDYGFYFELKLEPDGRGTSHIVSDAEGGNATHRLTWRFEETSNRLDFEETELIEESVPAWRWCIKSGSLFFKKEENRLSLSGDWSGYIEGFTAQTGACAPGKLYVERPVFKPEDLVATPSEARDTAPAEKKPVDIIAYEKNQGRNVEVERVLEVKSRTVRIRVWDSGTVDGDICTLFLNGKIILKNYRTVRSKHETIVQLEKPTNFLILHAINLGKIPPNTISISVDDGVKEQVVILSSNLKTSGAIMFREFTIPEN